MSELEGSNQTDDSNKAELSSREMEKLEEAKIRAKFPMTANKPLSGHSAFLQKRLAKGQKFFDSGDYNMARQKQAPRTTPAAVPVYGTGETIPTPETVPHEVCKIVQIDGSVRPQNERISQPSALRVTVPELDVKT